MKKLINELKSVPWYLLGINLDLEVSELNIIDSNYRGNDLRCKTEVLSCWLYKQATPNTWEAVANALNSMGEYRVEQVIREKYITPSTGNYWQHVEVRQVGTQNSGLIEMMVLISPRMTVKLKCVYLYFIAQIVSYCGMYVQAVFDHLIRPAFYPVQFSQRTNVLLHLWL